MRYDDHGYVSIRQDDKGPELMANFVARIDAEVQYVDGATKTTTLTLSGEMPPPADGSTDGKPVPLPPIQVDSVAFQNLGWVMPNWGTRCIIYPGAGIKDDLRTMIQQRSTPLVSTVYKQTGWVTISGKRVYLHVGGGIGKNGNDKSVSVQLPPELSKYNLACDAEPEESIAASLDLINICDSTITWPLLCATLAPLYGPVDFAMHLTGRTGSFKSELMSLYQSHYGAGMDARNLPGSWSSTPNALEALAFYACNAAFTIDDFVPGGTSWQQRAYQQNADKIIRAQGNQAGRARLTDTASLQQTMYPRGEILSTGEDTPEGHSVRARMLIMEIAAGDIDAENLTTAQAARSKYPGTVAWLVQSLAKTPANIKPRVEQIRAAQRAIGHSRTPGMLGRLIATAEDFLTRASDEGLISVQLRDASIKDATTAIMAAGAKQQGFLEDADPVDVFTAAIRQTMASGGGHMRSLQGGVPNKAELLGWTSERSSGEMETYKSRGPCIGWVKWASDEMFLDVTAGYAIVKKVAGPDLALSKQTLFKRLKDAGTLPRVDEARGRNMIRVVAEKHPRQVLCLSLSTTLQVEDITNVEEADPSDSSSIDADPLTDE